LPNNRELAQKGGASAQPFGLALGHMAPYDLAKGARTRRRGLAPDFLLKVGFITNFWVLIVIKPIFNGFSPFLGVIGQFWSLNSWRKLEMSNQLPSYITKACLKPWEGISE
jgi:hypothetical protein